MCGGRGYMGNLYTFLSILLWIQNCSKTIKYFFKYHTDIFRIENIFIKQWTSLCNNTNTDTVLKILTSINSKRILELSVKRKTIKILKDHTAEYLCDLGFGNEFLDTIPKVCSVKEKISWTLLKLKTFVLLKTLLRE